jgi:hypothetical protein
MEIAKFRNAPKEETTKTNSWSFSSGRKVLFILSNSCSTLTCFHLLWREVPKQHTLKSGGVYWTWHPVDDRKLSKGRNTKKKDEEEEEEQEQSKRKREVEIQEEEEEIALKRKQKKPKIVQEEKPRLPPSSSKVGESKPQLPQSATEGGISSISTGSIANVGSKTFMDQLGLPWVKGAWNSGQDSIDKVKYMVITDNNVIICI